MVLVPAFSEPAMSTTLRNPLFSFKFMFYIFLLILCSLIVYPRKRAVSSNHSRAALLSGLEMATAKLVYFFKLIQPCSSYETMGRMWQTLCRNVIGMASTSVPYSLFPSETPQARTPQSGFFTVFYLDIPPGWPYIKQFPAF